MGLTPEPITRVKTKIVATVGPASESIECLTALVEAGADVFRLNLAHATREWHESVLERIHQVSRQLDHPVAVLADLAGPKIRLGPIPGESVECTAGEVFRFVADPAEVRSPHDLSANYPSLVSDLQVNDHVLLADGTVSLQVGRKEPGVAVCHVVQPGEIRSGSGVHLPGIDLPLPALTQNDREYLQWVATRQIDFVGLSFVRRAEDAELLRAELTRLASKAQIIAKIERSQAVDALDRIIRESDGIMVARGDLGVEIDLARIAAVQKQIIRRCHQARVPVITATQMLESMRSNRLPTRAEATDVANAILDGTDAVMLSAETAVGRYPMEAVSMMSRIAGETEQMLKSLADHQPAAGTTIATSPVRLALVEAAGRLADQLCARLLVVASRSGRTALALSKQRSLTPTLGISDNADVVRRMCLYWGVTPVQTGRFSHSAELLKQCLEWAGRRGLLARGDRLVIIGNTPWGQTEQDMVLVHEVK